MDKKEKAALGKSLTAISILVAEVRDCFLEILPPAPEPPLKVGDYALDEHGDIMAITSTVGTSLRCYFTSQWINPNDIMKSRSELTRTTIEPGDCVRNRESNRLGLVVYNDEKNLEVGFENECGVSWPISNCILIAKGGGE